MNVQPEISPSTLTLSSLRQMVSQLARLCEISVTLNSKLEIDPLLQFIIETATEVLDCEAAAIMLYDEHQGDLLFAASTGSDPEKLARIRVPLEGSIAGTIFRENRPVLVHNVDDDPRHFDKVGKQVNFKTRSLIGVPMVMRDRVIGVLEALNKRRQPFSQKDIHLLSIIANQAAVAIHNARLHHELKQAYNELKQIDKLKSDFLAIASHELRTPLGVILGYAAFLKEEAQGELSEHATMVMNSAMRLRALVEDMTNMTMMQVGALDVKMKPVVVQKVIRAAIEEIFQTTEAKGHTLEVDLPESPLLVMADPPKLELVFTNVLNNAVRFTPPDGLITVQVKSKNKEVWTWVKDTGIGIPTSELKNIFEKFYQVEDHMVRRYGGMGLGLSIAKGLVDLHRGRIWAESEGENKGTTIVIVLPQVEP